MLDTSIAAKWFDEGYESNSLLQFAVFNNRVLLDFDHAASQLAFRVVSKEARLDDVTSTSEDALLAAAPRLQEVTSVVLEKFRRFGAESMIPVFRKNDLSPAVYSRDAESELGVPLYAVDRVELLLELEKQGYSRLELGSYAKFEQGIIEDVVIDGNLAYCDSDAETIANHYQEHLDAQSARGSFRASPGAAAVFPPEMPPEKLERLRDKYRALIGHEDDLSSNERRKVARLAYQIRFINEFIRIHLTMSHRAKVRAGYSYFVFHCSSTYTFADDATVYGDLNWHQTVRGAAAIADENQDGGDSFPIRLPGCKLDGDRVEFKIGRSSDYESLHRQLDLDGYFRAFAEVKGIKTCLNCKAEIEAKESVRKKFCSDRCRNAAKQRNFRARNPEAHNIAQEKYYSSAYADELN